jgi:hypothetical protein
VWLGFWVAVVNQNPKQQRLHTGQQFAFAEVDFNQAEMF